MAAEAAPTVSRRPLKRALDLVLAPAALVLLSPVFALISIAIALDSSGPVFFRQTRTGLGGHPFRIFKFRTMTVLEDGDQVVQARLNDARVTRVGRWLRRTSLDELPQLLNVVQGDMSLVGPRPHALAHDRHYAALISDYALRWQVRPGITGWAQINGLRGETPTIGAMRARVQHDNWYARRGSLALDLVILLRTPLEMIRQRGAW
jgi:putative colanic acid biosynthesis UDP-glucose lipid carrier transferase